jgi:hypothetical protein
MTYDIRVDRLHFELVRLLDFEAANVVLEYHVCEEPEPEILFSHDPEGLWYMQDDLELGGLDECYFEGARSRVSPDLDKVPRPRTPPEVMRTAIMSSLRDMFCDGETKVDEDEEWSKQTAVLRPMSRTHNKHPAVCNIESEQLWRILDKHFGFGVTSVIMGYTMDEAPPAEDLFQDDSGDVFQQASSNRRGLHGIEVYNQPPEVTNDSFYRVLSVADQAAQADEVLNEWMAVQKETFWDAHKDKRPDVMTSIREAFACDKTRVEDRDWVEEYKDECKDVNMSDRDEWNDVWQAAESRSNAFEGLFNDDRELFSLVEDDWEPTGRLASAAVDLDARAVDCSMFGMAF